jgi:hypothetical protein
MIEPPRSSVSLDDAPKLSVQTQIGKKPAIRPESVKVPESSYVSVPVVVAGRLGTGMPRNVPAGPKLSTNDVRSTSNSAVTIAASPGDAAQVAASSAIACAAREQFERILIIGVSP